MNRRMRWALALPFLVVAVGTAEASPTLDAVLACRKGVTKFGQKYGHKRRILLLNCVDKLLACEVRQELDGSNPNGCRTTAESSCNNTLGPASTTPLSIQRQRFHDKAVLACAGAPFATVLSNLAGGLWYANDANCGASADLPTFIDCLRDQWLDVETDTLVGQTKPRAGFLLDNMGLGTDFPSIPRPPTFDVVVAAAVAGGGDLVNPGTISPGAGTAVRFSGDSLSLPCGMSSSNGKLTITILPLAEPCNSPQVLQENLVKENYGPARTATFGPFTTDVTYCVDIQDTGACNETETGTIDVP